MQLVCFFVFVLVCLFVFPTIEKIIARSIFSNIIFFLLNADFPTTAPTEPEKMNITFIYGPVTGVLVLMLVAFAIYGLLKRRNRKYNPTYPNL